MTNNTLANFKVYALGFSTFEQSTIETFFRLAARRAPFWAVSMQIDDASVVLLNASSRQEVDAYSAQAITGKKVVIVGSSDLGTGWPVLSRPLRLTTILTTLNDLLPSAPQNLAPIAAQSLPPAGPNWPLTGGTIATSAPASMGASVTPNASVYRPAPPTPARAPGNPAFVGTKSANQLWPLRDIVASPAPVALQARPVQAAQPAPAPAARQFTQAPAATAFQTGPAANTSRSQPAAVGPEPVARQVLIVDDSDVALKFMQSRMRVFGFESKLARSGEEALALIERQDFQFVLLDVMMAGLDGYQTCRAIKQNKHKRASVPVVVMLTSRGGTIDKIRGSMSGCDAYLTKPLNEQQLGLVLAKHGAVTLKPGARPDLEPRPGGSAYSSRNAGRTL